MLELETKRLFIAVLLPASIKSHLENYQKELKKAGADVKWVESQNIHLTLKFLGEAKTGQIPQIVDCLGRPPTPWKRIPVTLNQFGFFPAKKSSRVLWAGLNDKTRGLEKIALFLEEALVPFGFAKETRAFQSHITLGRIRSSQNMSALIEKINELNGTLQTSSDIPRKRDENFKITDFLVDNITLFESALSPGGPVYSIVHQIKFL